MFSRNNFVTFSAKQTSISYVIRQVWKTIITTYDADDLLVILMQSRSTTRARSEKQQRDANWNGEIKKNTELQLIISFSGISIDMSGKWSNANDEPITSPQQRTQPTNSNVFEKRTFFMRLADVFIECSHFSRLLFTLVSSASFAFTLQTQAMTKSRQNIHSQMTAIMKSIKHSEAKCVAFPMQKKTSTKFDSRT